MSAAAEARLSVPPDLRPSADATAGNALDIALAAIQDAILRDDMQALYALCDLIGVEPSPENLGTLAETLLPQRVTGKERTPQDRVLSIAKTDDWKAYLRALVVRKIKEQCRLSRMTAKGATVLSIEELSDRFGEGVALAGVGGLNTRLALDLGKLARVADKDTFSVVLDILAGKTRNEIGVARYQRAIRKLKTMASRRDLKRLWPLAASNNPPPDVFDWDLFTNEPSGSRETFLEDVKHITIRSLPLTDACHPDPFDNKRRVG